MWGSVQVRFRVTSTSKLLEATEDGRHVLGMVDHLRGQVDADGLMAFLRHQAGEKACPGADVQHAKRPPLRQVFAKFRKPAVLFLTFKFPQALGLKALRPVGPVMRHAMLDSLHAVTSQYTVDETPRIGVLRIFNDVVRRPLFHDAALVHHQHPVAELLHQGNIVANKQDGQASSVPSSQLV